MTVVTTARQLPTALLHRSPAVLKEAACSYPTRSPDWPRRRVFRPHYSTTKFARHLDRVGDVVVVRAGPLHDFVHFLELLLCAIAGHPLPATDVAVFSAISVAASPGC